MIDYPNKGMHKSYTVQKISIESENTNSIFFKGSISIKPGQFVMVWIPGVGEKPYAVSYLTANSFGITSHGVGDFSKSLNKSKIGDKIGIRGPYGNGFTMANYKKNTCIVSGGVGLASLSLLIEILDKPVVLAGFRSKAMMLYHKRFPNMNIATDDGSYGYHGFVTDIFKKEIVKNKFKVVYTCGPEIMMKKIFDICEDNGIECQAALERYMKCGFGICGNCMCNDKIVCMDGPVFNSKQLVKMSDFGNFARLKTGRKVNLKEYYGFKS